MATPLFAGGSGPVTSLVNFFSAGGAATGNSISASNAQNAKETLSGALTANTLSTIHTFTGRGRLNLLTAYAKDGTARTIRVVIIVDGTTAFDATSSSVSLTGAGMIPVGVVTNATGALDFQPIDFQTSLVIRVASSLTETDKVATGINYELWA